MNVYIYSFLYEKNNNGIILKVFWSLIVYDYKLLEYVNVF